MHGTTRTLSARLPGVGVATPDYHGVKSSVKMSMDSVPKDLRGLRACKLCSMVKVSPYIYSKAVE